MIERKAVDADLDHVTWMCWPTMHGLVELEPRFDMMSELRDRDPVSTRELVRRSPR